LLALIRISHGVSFPSSGHGVCLPSPDIRDWSVSSRGSSFSRIALARCHHSAARRRKSRRALPRANGGLDRPAAAPNLPRGAVQSRTGVFAAKESGQAARGHVSRFMHRRPTSGGAAARPTAGARVAVDREFHPAGAVDLFARRRGSAGGRYFRRVPIRGSHRIQ